MSMKRNVSTKVVALSGVLGALATFGSHTASATELQGFRVLGSGSQIRSQILEASSSSSSSSGEQPTDKGAEGKCGEGKCGSSKK